MREHFNLRIQYGKGIFYREIRTEELYLLKLKNLHVK